MQASGVFADAVLAAQEMVSRLGPNDEAALLTVEGLPRIVSSFSNDGRELRGKLASLAPSDAGGGMEETLLLARRLLDAKPGEKRLFVISDRKVPASGSVEQIAVGKSRDNVGILALAQRPLPASPQSTEIFVKLGNFSSSARDTEIELSLDGRSFDLQRFRIDPGETRNFSTIVPKQMLASGSGFLMARLTSADGLAVDNTAYAALPTGQSLRVLLIGEDDPFLEGALKADPSLAVEILKPEMWRSDMGADFDAVVFDNWLPQDATLDSLGRGSFFFFGRTPFNVAGAETPMASLEAGFESPLLWNVDLGAIRLARASKLAIPDDGRWRISIPVQSAGEPMVVTMEGPRGRARRRHRLRRRRFEFPLASRIPPLCEQCRPLARGAQPGSRKRLEGGPDFHSGKRRKHFAKTSPRGRSGGRGQGSATYRDAPQIREEWALRSARALSVPLAGSQYGGSSGVRPPRGGKHRQHDFPS